MERELIVNADDFGRSDGVNRGIIEAAERGIVTSASLMVRFPAAAPAAAWAKSRTDFSLGLHVDLGEWDLVGNHWVARYEVVDRFDAAAVAGEIARQVEAFRGLVGRVPTHVDSHQHVHRREPVRAAAVAASAALGARLRAVSGPSFVGGFYGRGDREEHCPHHLTRENLLRLVAETPAGVSELSCHPGFADDLDSAYRDERAREVAVLCDPEVRAGIASLGVRLRCH